MSMLREMISNKAASATWALALAAALLSACGASDRSAGPSAAAPTLAAPIAAAPAGDRLYIRDGFKGGDQRLTIIDSASGARERDLPPGLASPDWTTLYVAERNDDKTTLRAFDLATGRALRETTVDGAYDLPMITPNSVMGGLSPDGRWLALTSRATAKRTEFMVFDTAFEQQPRRAVLEGYFLFDGLNNSGSSLFLTEILGDDPSAHYLVRRYDLSQGLLDPNVIVEKGEEDEPMSGVRQTAVASKQGDWLYSLYLDAEHGPFIHALPINDPQFAFCIDLPTDAKDDLAKQSRWSLLLSADKRTLYAANGALGLVADYNLGDGVPQMLRTKSLLGMPDAGGDANTPAQPSTNSIAALAPNGNTLYALGQRGLLVIDTQALTLRGRYLPDWSLDGVAVSADSARLYAASAAQGKIVRLDPSAGTIAAEVPAGGRPSGLVRAEAVRQP
jgi:hypothetical protein